MSARQLLLNFALDHPILPGNRYEQIRQKIAGICRFTSSVLYLGELELA